MINKHVAVAKVQFNFSDLLAAGFPKVKCRESKVCFVDAVKINLDQKSSSVILHKDTAERRLCSNLYYSDRYTPPKKIISTVSQMHTSSSA